MAETEETKKVGTFKADLMRTFKQLKESRAESVTEDVEIIYKRKIEDLCHKIRSFDRDQENLVLDLSPMNVGTNGVVPSDFDASKFCGKDIEISLNRRVAVIELEIAIQRYEALFGEIVDKTAILKVLPNYQFSI